MSSLTFENYEQGSIHITYRWNKCEPYTAMVAIVKDGLAYPIRQGSYATKEQARRAFRRYVRLAKQGAYDHEKR